MSLGIKNTCRRLFSLYTRFGNHVGLSDSLSNLTSKHEIVLELLLGVQRNKRGLKRLSFGLCINRMVCF